MTGTHPLTTGHRAGTSPAPGGGCTVHIEDHIEDEQFQIPGPCSAFGEVTGLAHAPRGTRAPIASGAGSRFALAGAKCERRLPARHGPAPEVPAGKRVPYRDRRVVRAGRTVGERWTCFHPDHTEGYR